MIDILKLERLKTKRTIVPKLIWVIPLLVCIITTLLFSTTGYIIESVINQWSFLWLNVFLALEIGLIDRSEKLNTQYKMIISSPINLSKFEFGRILHGILLALKASIVLIILVIVSSTMIRIRVSLINCIIAVLGILTTSLWEVPFYTWLSRKTNIYITVIIAFLGSFVGISIANLSWGKFFPYTWPAMFPVSFTKMNINGTLLSLSANGEHYLLALIFSVVLLMLASLGTIWSFKKQVTYL